MSGAVTDWDNRSAIYPRLLTIRAANIRRSVSIRALSAPEMSLRVADEAMRPRGCRWQFAMAADTAMQPTAMPINASLPGKVPHSGVPSRQRTANRQAKGLTAVSGDQASDLALPGSGGGI